VLIILSLSWLSSAEQTVKKVLPNLRAQNEKHPFASWKQHA